MLENTIIKFIKLLWPGLISFLVFISLHVDFQYFTQQTHWGQILNDVSLAIWVSYFFYFLVVYIPNNEKEKIIKTNFKKSFDKFRKDIIFILVSKIELYNSDHDNLLDQDYFRIYFKTITEDGSMDRWDIVLNALENDERAIKDIISQFELLQDDCQFILLNLEIRDENKFNQLKRIAQIPYQFKNFKITTDDIKELSQVLWSIFTGFSFSEGYSKKESVVSFVKSL